MTSINKIVKSYDNDPVHFTCKYLTSSDLTQVQDNILLKSIDEMRNENKLRKNIVTFFYQGHSASRGQGATYAGPEGIRCLYNNETLEYICPTAPRLLHNLYTYHELSDLSYHSYNPFLNALKLSSYISNKTKNIIGPSHITHITEWSIGGHNDIAHYTDNVKKMIDENPDKKIVLFGCSRGAATTLIGLSQLEEQYQKKISLVIVEAPFTSVPNVLYSWRGIRFLAPAQLYLLDKFGNYDPNQPTPLSALEKIYPNIPLAFITTSVDTVVPEELTLELIEKLRELGHYKIYHCGLDKSAHEMMPIDNINDQNKYYDFVESLYIKYC